MIVNIKQNDKYRELLERINDIKSLELIDYEKYKRFIKIIQILDKPNKQLIKTAIEYKRFIKIIQILEYMEDRELLEKMQEATGEYIDTGEFLKKIKNERRI